MHLYMGKMHTLILHIHMYTYNECIHVLHIRIHAHTLDTHSVHKCAYAYVHVSIFSLCMTMHIFAHKYVCVCMRVDLRELGCNYRT